MHILFIIIFCLISMPCLAAEGYPDERPLTPDYSKLYYMGHNNKTSSSPCIGNPVTPECAVDTYEACISWSNKKLCAMMNYQLPDPAPVDDIRMNLIYKYVGKRLITADDIPNNYQGVWQVGDMVIFTAWQVCSRYDHCYTALNDRSDPKGVCKPLDCDAAGYYIHPNGKHAPKMYILRQKPDKTWLIITRIDAWDLDHMEENRPEKLFNEGLSQMPW